MDDTSKTGAEAAPATETAAQTAANSATGANGGEVKVVVEQKPEPTRAEVAAKSEADLRAAQDAAFDKATKKAEADRIGDAADRAEATSRGEQPRAADGKFSTAPGKVAEVKEGHNQPPKDAPTADAKPKGQNAQAEKSEQAPAAPAHALPQSWPRSMGEVWSKMPPEAQKYVSDRDKDVARTITRNGQELQRLKVAENLIPVVAEYGDTLKGWGMGADAAFRNLMDTAIDLDRDPHAGIEKLAKSYKIDLAQYALSLLDPNDLPADPRIGQYQARIEALQRQVAQLENVRKADRTEREREAAGAAERHRAATFEQSFVAVNDSVEKFAKERPDYARLEPAIAKLIGPLMDANPDLSPESALAEAYDIARARDPEARKQTIDAEVTARDKRREDALRQQAEAARAANAVNVQGASQVGAMLTERQKLDAAFDRGMAINRARNA